MPRGRPRRHRKLKAGLLHINDVNENAGATDSSDTDFKLEEEYMESVNHQKAVFAEVDRESDSAVDIPARKRLTEGKIDVDEDLESADGDSAEDEIGEDMELSAVAGGNTGDSRLTSVTSPLEKAADSCRLPPRRLTPDEYALLPFLKTASPQLQEAYLSSRNSACFLWNDDPTVQITTDRLIGFLVSSSDKRVILSLHDAGLTAPIPVDADKTNGSPPQNWNPLSTPVARQNLERLAYITIVFLERYGFINVGAFTVLTVPLTLAVKSPVIGVIDLTEKTTSRRAFAGRGINSGTVPIKVVVCGAGAAGLIAARQLTYFGAKVTILEARDRIGGRIWTYKKKDQFADLGAMIVTGRNGNPSTVIARQGGLTMQPISQWCSLYAPSGRPVAREKDERMEEEFNRLLSTAAHLATTQASSDAKAASLSLGEVIEDLIRYQENHVVPLKTTHRKLVSLLLERKAKTLSRIAEARGLIERAYNAWRLCCESPTEDKPTMTTQYTPPPSLPTTGSSRRKRSRVSADSADSSDTDAKASSAKRRPSSTRNSSQTSASATPTSKTPPQQRCFDVDQEFKKRRLLSQLHMAWKDFDPLQCSLGKINRQLEILAQNPPCDVYLSSSERNLIDWHLANLEFANATELTNLSLLHWDQDDAFELTGAHCTVRGGFNQLLEVLTNSAGGERPTAKASGEVDSLTTGGACGQIELKSSVKAIRLSDNGVVVDCLNTAFSQDEVISYNADVALCALPLGVLKKSVETTSRSGDAVEATKGVASTPAPIFVPPLPEWKAGAIRRLGFGTLNKVVLFFDHFFWDRSQRFFGCVHDSKDRRGELFLFWSITDKPCLIALVAGKSAVRLEEELSAKAGKGTLGDDESFLREPIVSRAMTILRKIFSRESAEPIPDPVDAYITRWSADANSRGSYSYVAVGASGDDYDLLAAPLQSRPPEPVTLTPDGDMPCTTVVDVAEECDHEDLPRVFFAGEHTCRYYPASVHGAMFSGLREVARIANTLFPGETPILDHGFTLSTNQPWTSSTV